MYFGPVIQRAVIAAGEHAQTGLLQYAHVMVVSIAHGPATEVLLGLFTALVVHVLTVTIRPFLELFYQCILKQHDIQI
jgi:hypothetical protein